MALATFFVSPDVVFSCLDLAEQNVHATPWECALAHQRVFASYGLYAEERASFEKWHKGVPVVSWIYDEMVMAHVGSQFHHLQESMFEILVAQQRLLQGWQFFQGGRGRADDASFMHHSLSGQRTQHFRLSPLQPVHFAGCF